MVVLLVALVIVALLAQSALRQYGLLGGAPPAGKSADAERVPGGAAPASPDPSTAALPPRAPMERARAVEQTVQQGAQDLSRRIDEQTK